MQTYKKYKRLLRSIIILQILNLFLLTSCSLKDFKKNDNFHLDGKINQFKKLVIPKGMHFPKTNEEYNIPEFEQDLKKNRYDIFPPI